MQSKSRNGRKCNITTGRDAEVVFCKYVNTFHTFVCWACYILPALTNQSVPNSNGCLSVSAESNSLFPSQPQQRVESRFMCTMCTCPEHHVCRHFAAPGLCPRCETHQARVDQRFSAHEAPISEPSAVIWGMFSAHFMDIYVPGL